LPHHDDLPFSYFAGRFGWLLIHFHRASPACISRQGSRFENANGPQPFIETRSRGSIGRIVGFGKQGDREPVGFAVAGK
jgi:hypothetical protein